ncbi:MAG: hypothetical protein NTX87_20845, partial [Planctomycetota bacterium]|nr:hypothetical protein [Planctomycetota bacterium]
MTSKISACTSPDLRTRLSHALAAARPQSAEALWQFVRAAYGLAVPRRAVCPGHVAPMEYLARTILEPGRDLVIWASRGGAKTELGSIAAHLDSILRPGCQTRILGGSLDQSEKMYEYLMDKWQGPFEKMLARRPSARRTELVNCSTIEVLTQSPRSVRGQRVHRLKCDEVDEFSREVWQAAQFITQSSAGTDGRWIPAQMEVFSTLHRACGPMATLVDRITNCELRGGSPHPPRSAAADSGTVEPHMHARETCAAGTETRRAQTLAPPPANPQFARSLPAAAGNPQLLKWCLWETIEPCPPERSCSRCPLASDCDGRARGADGYFPIDDAIAQHARASRAAWEAEMLCIRPSAEGLVFAEFDPRRHVAPVAYNPALPLYRAIDFGYANPFVCLWVQVDDNCGLPNADSCGTAGLSSRGCAPETFPRLDKPAVPHCSSANPQSMAPDLSRVQFRVIGEYVARERAIGEHARTMASRDPGPVLATYADPAGWQRTDVTGTGPCQELAAMGIKVRTPHAGILEGVELIRRLLKDRGSGPERAGLVIDPSCRWLVRAMQEYHWDEAEDGRRGERPAKDGADHPIDALRYLATGLFLRRG